jgi:hypothetical protein
MTDDERAGYQRVIADCTARLRQATRELVRLRHAAQRVVDLTDDGYRNPPDIRAVRDAREHLRAVLDG